MLVERTSRASQGSQPQVPAGILASQSTLFRWLGSFWSSVFEDPDFVKYLQGARSARLAQLYLDVMESAALVDRFGAPAFHRERWMPVRILRSQRNTASPDFIRIGGEKMKIGPQDGEVYESGTVFTIGGRNVSIPGMVAYPAGTGAIESARCAVDCISSPSEVLRRGVDFDIVGGTVLVNDRHDPFSDESGFPVFELDDGDAESVIWLCDAEIDKGYVDGHLGYAMGLSTGSTEGMKRLVNAVWDAVSEGSTARSLSALLSAVCGVPVALHDGEVVQSIDRFDDGLYVVTDMESYRLPPLSEVADGISVGTRLTLFQQLDGCVRVYPYVTDPDKLEEYSEFGDKFRSDVPALDIPPALVSTDVDDGFHVGWDERDVVCGGLDANRHPRLWFRMDGSDEDNASFWNDVWSRYEKSGESMERCFDGNLVENPVFEAGEVCGSVSPMRFFLRNLVGANTVIVTIRTDSLDRSSPLFDPEFFGVVRSCMPDHVRVFFIEHESVGQESTDVGLAEDSVSESVGRSVYDEENLSSARGFRASDGVVSSRLVPACR